jgi:hypothetical protein
VPRLEGEGTEILKSTEDAREWQEAVRSILVQEVRERAETKVDESAGFLETIHASIDLFKNNPDLIPGTRGFNKNLADRFADLAEPYEVRVDGKLQGYSIPVQPIINNLRKQMKPTPPPAPPAAPPKRKADPPQAGLQSKASSSSEPEDFSTLFGTIGLPNLRI